jgi:hypothetical protein
VNTSGWTKYYLTGSFVASLIIMIPGGQSNFLAFDALLTGIRRAAVHGVWGWDPIGDECYISLEDADGRFLWQVSTGYTWSFRE